jgi:multisubunit Na+/H+ antiporter MnhC subunit
MTQAILEPEVSAKPRLRLHFGVTIFTGAFLLFQVQPILGKYILPWFGGMSSVWTTCMLFFQVLLLGGYLYSHLLSTRLKPPAQARVHIILLAATLALVIIGAVLWKAPILPGTNWRPASPENPIPNVLLVLAIAVGLLYLVLSSTGPLMQNWFAYAHSGESPYRLYALSNLGSLLGLITYPLLFEPAFGLRTQAWIWSAGYMVFLAGSLLCALRLRNSAGLDSSERRREHAQAATKPEAAPSRSTQLLWFLLAGFASLMLLATTNLICQDVAVIPFLWVLPLSLYLLSLIVCFDNPKWYRRGVFHTLLALALPFAVLGFLKTTPSKPVPFLIAIFNLVLFASCMVCHGELVRLKPHPAYLTRFYLMVSAGGAAGGVFVALIAPLIFSGYWEYHVGLTGCVLLVIVVLMRDRTSWWYWPGPALGFIVLLGLALVPHLCVKYMGFSKPPRVFLDFHYYALLAVFTGAVGIIYLRARKLPAAYKKFNLAQAAGIVVLLALAGGYCNEVIESSKGQLRRDRNFYGSLIIYFSSGAQPANVLVHGKTTHGYQLLRSPKIPTMYYGVSSGLGLFMQSRPMCFGPCQTRYGLIGMGVGTIAAYGRQGETMRFYEINPQVINYSSGPDPYFTFIRDSAARIEAAPGDARLSLERELKEQQPGNFDLLVVDAFNSDAIPVHLLTQEAFQIYLRHLRSADSVLAFHISNRVLDLRRVLAGLVIQNHLYCVRLHNEHAADVDEYSDWVFISRNPEVLNRPTFKGHIAEMPPFETAILWTDDYSNLLQILKH